MQQDKVAILTTVRDDDFFLKKWVDYYGGLFGKEALYVINHGNQPAVRNIAAGCNLFPIPDGDRRKFNVLNWRTKNHLMQALLRWYQVVIVCDVDEFVVIDPATGHDLRSWLDAHPARTVRTAMGMEVTHLPSEEPEPVSGAILGPRRWAQMNCFYAKPCIISRKTKLSRGGHYAEHDRLDMPDCLYMFHMKYCDYDLYVDTLNRRRAIIDGMNIESTKDTTTNIQWFAQNRDDDGTFRAFEERPRDTDWDFAPYRAQFHESWGPRGHNLYHFKRANPTALFRIPERFAGIC